MTVDKPINWPDFVDELADIALNTGFKVDRPHRDGLTVHYRQDTFYLFGEHGYYATSWYDTDAGEQRSTAGRGGQTHLRQIFMEWMHLRIPA